MGKLMVNVFVVMCLFLTLSNVAVAKLTPEQDAARAKGLFYYNMEDDFNARPFLEISAEAGDSESQYYLAEIIRSRDKYVGPEAQRLYEGAADQGDIYAMLRLIITSDDLCHLMENCTPSKKTPKEWRDAARLLAEERASEGDGEAMYQLYMLTGNFDWIIKSAEAGFAESQEWLGSLYKEGVGRFFIPGKRQWEVERWLRASALAGYPPGMVKYSELLEKRGDLKGVGYWIEKAAEAGHFGAMSGLAAWTAHMPDKVGYPLDLVKAYGLTLLMAEANPGNAWLGPSYGETELIEVAAKMTPEQIEEGKAYAKEWAKSHPALSRFPPKYGY